MIRSILGAALRRHPNRCRNWIGPQSYDPAHLTKAVQLGTESKSAYLEALKGNHGTVSALRAAELAVVK